MATRLGGTSVLINCINFIKINRYQIKSSIFASNKQFKYIKNKMLIKILFFNKIHHFLWNYRKRNCVSARGDPVALSRRSNCALIWTPSDGVCCVRSQSARRRAAFYAIPPRHWRCRGVVWHSTARRSAFTAFSWTPWQRGPGVTGVLPVDIFIFWTYRTMYKTPITLK